MLLLVEQRIVIERVLDLAHLWMQRAIGRHYYASVAVGRATVGDLVLQLLRFFDRSVVGTLHHPTAVLAPSRMRNLAHRGRPPLPPPRLEPVRLTVLELLGCDVHPILMLLGHRLKTSTMPRQRSSITPGPPATSLEHHRSSTHCST